MLPKPKAPSEKAILDKTKTSHQRFLESSNHHVFGFLNFNFKWMFLVLADFGLIPYGLIISTLRFSTTNYQNLAFKKYFRKMNPL